MAEIKTKLTKVNPRTFIRSITDVERRQDSEKLLEIFEKITGEKAKMWGTSIVGFGSYHYESARSSQKGDWPLTAFSPRKQNLSLYVMPGFKPYQDLMEKLGKHKTSVGCLYIKRLSDINVKILTQLIKRSFIDMKKKYL